MLLGGLLSSSSPSIQIIPESQLIIHGKAVPSRKPMRPHTTSGQRKTVVDRQDEEDRMSEISSNSGETYLVEGKVERRMREKMERMGRSMRASERARREMEGELEEWRRKYELATKELPELREELAEVKKGLAEYRTRSEELEKERDSLSGERALLEERVSEKERESGEILEAICALLIEEQGELDSFEKKSGNVMQLVKVHLRGQSGLLEERRELMEKLRKGDQQLEKAKEHVAKLMEEIDSMRKRETQRSGIEKEEMEISHDQTISLKAQLHKMELYSGKSQADMDLIRAELRCALSKNKELEHVLRNNSVVIKALESERKAFADTVSALLGMDDRSTEADIKKQLRDKLQEMDENRTAKLRAEQQSERAETILVNQAKEHRNALYRARTAEEEIAVLSEKLVHMESELLSMGVELRAGEKKMGEVEAVVGKLAELLGVNSTSVVDGVMERVEQLVACERAYTTIVGDTRIESEALLRQLRLGKRDGHLDGIKRSLRAVDTSSATQKALDRMDRQLMTQMTLETIRVADTEKALLKRKMAEQEKKIRDLEKEKRESERVRKIVGKWERKAPVTVQHERERTNEPTARICSSNKKAADSSKEREKREQVGGAKNGGGAKTGEAANSSGAAQE